MMTMMVVSIGLVIVSRLPSNYFRIEWRGSCWNSHCNISGTNSTGHTGGFCWHQILQKEWSIWVRIILEIIFSNFCLWLLTITAIFYKLLKANIYINTLAVFAELRSLRQHQHCRRKVVVRREDRQLWVSLITQHLVLKLNQLQPTVMILYFKTLLMMIHL